MEPETSMVGPGMLRAWEAEWYVGEGWALSGAAGFSSEFG